MKQFGPHCVVIRTGEVGRIVSADTPTDARRLAVEAWADPATTATELAWFQIYETHSQKPPPPEPVRRGWGGSSANTDPPSVATPAPPQTPSKAKERKV